ncbi:MAG: hypothetical protein U0931_38845 [Vulcanimicrobiota bacterium]
MRKILFLLLLTLPALALPTPEELVTRLYRTHLKTQDMRKTVAQLPQAFSPEFLETAKQALARPGADTDIFTHTKAMLTDFAVDDATIWTSRAEVHLRFWTGDRVGQQKSVPQPVTVYLIDEEQGAGYQVQDIQFPGRPPFKVRDYLTQLTGGQPKTP